MADTVSHKILRYMVSRAIIRGKSREEILTKLDASGFTGAHAEQVIAQAEQKVLSRNRRCAIISAIITLALLYRLIWGPYADHDEMRMLMAALSALFLGAGFYFWYIARWQAPPLKTPPTAG